MASITPRPIYDQNISTGKYLARSCLTPCLRSLLLFLNRTTHFRQEISNRPLLVALHVLGRGPGGLDHESKTCHAIRAIWNPCSSILCLVCGQFDRNDVCFDWDERYAQQRIPAQSRPEMF
jgi:hypothetical protein